MARKPSHIGDFGSLRDAFGALAEIYSLNGSATPGKKGITLAGIPRGRWSEIIRLVRANEDMVKS